MTDSAIAARIINALESAANREAGGKTGLVSVNMEMLTPANAGTVDVRVERKTRTLVFLHADFRSDTGARIASASSIHKILP